MAREPLPRACRIGGIAARRRAGALQELLEHATRCRGRAQHAGEEQARGAHQLRLARRGCALQRRLQACPAEHPGEPHRGDHRHRAVQARIAVEPRRIIGIAQALMLIVEHHGAIARHARGDDVGEQTRVAGLAQRAVGEQRAEAAHDDGAGAIGAYPEGVLRRVAFVGKCEREAVAGLAHAVGKRRVVRERHRLHDCGEVRMGAVGKEAGALGLIQLGVERHAASHALLMRLV